MPVNIVCVYKTKKFMNKNKVIEYAPSQVAWLKRMVENNVTTDHEFICLSDDPGIEKICKRIPLKHGWPGWWSKMELYRPGLFSGPVFYIDLDTVIVANIDNMLVPGKEGYFVVLRNLAHDHGFGSGLLAWEGDFSGLYEEFLKSPEYFIKRYRSSSHWGDQGFLQTHLEGAAYWQDHYPRAITSYYFEMHQKGIKSPPEGSRIVCFQGLPKPWDVSCDWIPRVSSFLA